MGRPPLERGTHGEVWVHELGPKTYRAFTRYRDRDGKTRLVGRTGQTKGRARAALMSALTERGGDGGQLTRDTRMDVIIDAWEADLASSDKAPNTKRLYRETCERHVRRNIGQLRISEVRTPQVNRLLRDVIAGSGPSMAKTTKAVLWAIFVYAKGEGATDSNPCRDSVKISIPRKPAQALQPDQITDLTDRVRTDHRAVMLDLPDLIDALLYTGCRIGEMLALRKSAIDLVGRRIEINSTIVRLTAACVHCGHNTREHPQRATCAICSCGKYEKTPGTGLVIQEHPKTSTSHRLLPMPDHLALMLERRAGEIRFSHESGVVFPSPRANTLRDPTNTQHELRAALDRLDYDWARSHTMRKTVATLLDAAGHTSRQVADTLGHAQISTTQNSYQGRRVVNVEAAQVLDRH